nr:lactate utilization protein B [uncultured Desulfobacter sp.]
MRPEPKKFKEKAAAALKDDYLCSAMAANQEFAAMVRQAVNSEPHLDEMKQRAREIKNHTLDHLAHYLEQYEKNAQLNDIVVHWAQTAAQARMVIQQICKNAGAKLAVCAKSMIAAEIDAPSALADVGVARYETDLGEYILQLAGDEPPSHVTGPAVHKPEEQIRQLFEDHHAQLGFSNSLDKPPEALLKDVRTILRDKFLSADVGVMGANFLIAETGANVLVTNEGNGDLGALIPKTRIVLASIEKVLPRTNDAELFLRLLCMSATGQKATCYQSFYEGPENNGASGPKQVHVILVDNGRSEILGSKYQAILRCIRCGACMDNCPVYNAVGGHAYGWIYPGPMGVVWTSLLTGLDHTGDLTQACTLNGHCSEVCPMGIPLKDMIRSLRDDQWSNKSLPLSGRLPIDLWGQAARHPALYHAFTSIAGSVSKLAAGEKGYIETLAGAKAWTGSRDFPGFSRRPFSRQWKKPKQR